LGQEIVDFVLNSLEVLFQAVQLMSSGTIVYELEERTGLGLTAARKFDSASALPDHLRIALTGTSDSLSSITKLTIEISSYFVEAALD
jgi:hypothetical protein